MAFLESPVFPGRIGANWQRTIRHQVEAVRTFNGRLIKNINSAQGLREYSFYLPATSATEYQLLQAHYLAVKGTAHSFRLQDPDDDTCVQADGYLGTSATGVGVPSYQIKKRYVSGVLTELRDIRKPFTSGLIIYRNASPATAGAGAGQYALDTTTGIVTWVADSSATASSHTVGASHQVTLNSALSGLVIGGKLYLTGVTGTAANTLNNLAHTISNIAGSTYTLSISTSGLTATGGTGWKYPQPADTLAWAGQFHTPVAYGSELTFERMSSGLFIAQQVSLLEEYV